jgi:hypothetical protein
MLQVVCGASEGCGGPVGDGGKLDGAAGLCQLHGEFFGLAFGLVGLHLVGCAVVAQRVHHIALAHALGNERLAVDLVHLDHLATHPRFKRDWAPSSRARRSAWLRRTSAMLTSRAVWPGRPIALCRVPTCAMAFA